MSNQKNYWPDKWEQGLIKTQNAMGVMFKELSPAAEAFVQYAKLPDFLYYILALLMVLRPSPQMVLSI